jgi:hypothetical protein
MRESFEARDNFPLLHWSKTGKFLSGMQLVRLD